MPSIDRWDSPSDIVVSDATPTTGDGQEQPSILANRRRRERVDLVVSGELKVTGNGANLVNRGSVLGAVSRLKYRIGKKPIYDMDARCARALGEFFAKGSLPAVRAPDALIQDTVLSEYVPIWLASPNSINPTETYYLDPPGENQEISVSMVPSRRAQVPGIIAGAAATLPNLKVQLQDVYDDDVVHLPDHRIFIDEIATDPITAKASGKRIDLKLPRLVRALLIQQDSDNGEVTTGSLITAFTLKTDRQTLRNKTNWSNYNDALAAEYGQACQDTNAYTFFDFQRFGRRTTWLDPANEDTGLRLELDVDPTGLANPFIRIVAVGYERIAGATAAETALGRATARAGR